MSLYKSIMQGLDEAVKYQEGKLNPRKIKVTLKPVEFFSGEDIKQIRNKTGLTQANFAYALGVSKKTVEAWEYGRNTPNGPSRRLIQLIRDNPEIIKQYVC